MASVSLAEVKLVGRAFGATVNDVMLATVGGALRNLLEERGEEIDVSARRDGAGFDQGAREGVAGSG